MDSYTQGGYIEHAWIKWVSSDTVKIRNSVIPILTYLYLNSSYIGLIPFVSTETKLCYKQICCAYIAGPNFMALLTVSSESTLTEAGNYVLTASVFVSARPSRLTTYDKIMQNISLVFQAQNV